MKEFTPYSFLSDDDLFDGQDFKTILHFLFWIQSQSNWNSGSGLTLITKIIRLGYRNIEHYFDNTPDFPEEKKAEFRDYLEKNKCEDIYLCNPEPKEVI
jgi:hypothetical protein